MDKDFVSAMIDQQIAQKKLLDAAYQGMAKKWPNMAQRAAFMTGAATAMGALCRAFDMGKSGLMETVFSLAAEADAEVDKMLAEQGMTREDL